MSSRDAEIVEVAAQVNKLMDQLNETVAALNAVLTGKDSEDGEVPSDG